MAVEIGTAYVQIVPSARGIKANLAKELGGSDLDAAAEQAGDSASTKFGGKFSAGLKLLGVGAGLALAGGLTKAFGDVLERGAITDNIAASLSLNDAQSAQAGRVAGDLYANAYGASFEDVGSQLEQTLRTFGADLSDAEAFGLTAGSIDLTAAFDLDGERLAQTTGLVLRNGLAGSAQEAQDVITAALQGISAPANDILDTFYEFSEPLASLGFDGAKSIGILSAAADAGAFELTKVGDAIKEFSIRAIDGSKASGESFKLLGLDGERLAADIAKGGPAAQKAFSEVLQAASGISDPLERERATVGLFATTLEDLGPAAIAALDPLNAAFVDTAGATANLGDTLNDNLKTKLETLKRKGFGLLVSFVESKVVPVMERLVDYLGSPEFVEVTTKVKAFASTVGSVVVPVLKAMGTAFVAVISLGAKIAGFFQRNKPLAIGLAAGLGVIAAAMLVFAINAQIAAIAASTFTLASIGLSLPILAVAAAIAVLVAGVIWAYKNVDWFREAVQAAGRFLKDKMLPAIKAVGKFIASNFVPALKAVVGFLGAFGSAVVGLIKIVGRGFAGIGSFFVSLVSTIGRGFAGIGEFFVSLGSAVAGLFTGIGSTVAGFVSTIGSGLVTVGGFFTGLLATAGGAITGVVGWVAGLITTVIEGAVIVGDTLLAVGGFFTGLLTTAGEVVTGVNDWIRGFVDRVVDLAVVVDQKFIGIKRFFQSLLDQVARTVDGLKKIVGFFSDAIVNLAGTVSDKFTAIKGFFGELLGKAGDVVDGIQGYFNGLIGALTALPSRVRSAATGLFDPLLSQAKSIFNSIARAWNNGPGAIGFSVPGWIPGVGGNSFNIPKIPILHNGGVIPGPVGMDRLILAEAGEEVISNDDRRNGRQAGAINFNAPVTVASPEEFVRVMNRRQRVSAA